MDSAIPPDLPGSPLRAEIDRKEDPGMDLQERGSEVDRLKAIESSKGFEEAKEVTAVESRDSKEVSWVKVAQEKKVLRKYDVEILNKDGVHTVEIPDEVLENPTPLWEDFVVGKFLDLAPHVAKVHMVLNRIWKYGDPSTRVEVYKVNSTTMRFKVSSLKAREKILRRGMWNIAGVPMVVQKWSPKSEEEKQEEEAVPMWVHLEKVPLHMYSWEGISFFTSTVGFPVKLHPETIACTNFDVAKVFVKVDVTKALPKEITFFKDGNQFTVRYYYPGLPVRCKNCDKWGHGEAACTRKVKDMKEKVGGGTVENGGSSEEVNDEVHNVKVVSGETDIEEVVVEDRNEGSRSALLLEEKMQNEGLVNKDTGASGGKERNAWSLVPPGKVGRLSVATKNTKEVQISASKFSILSMDDKEEGEILGDEKLQSDDGIDEGDLLEDTMVDQQVREEVKTGRRGRKPKALENPVKSIRSSRRKN